MNVIVPQTRNFAFLFFSIDCLSGGMVVRSASQSVLAGNQQWPCIVNTWPNIWPIDQNLPFSKDHLENQWWLGQSKNTSICFIWAHACLTQVGVTWQQVDCNPPGNIVAEVVDSRPGNGGFIAIALESVWSLSFDFPAPTKIVFWGSRFFWRKNKPNLVKNLHSSSIPTSNGLPPPLYMGVGVPFRCDK